MEISKLNERIVIEKNAVIVDAVGNHKNTWTEYFSCHAYASTYQAEEKEEATVTEERSVNFTVRWCSETSAVTSTGFRVRFRGEAYDIESVDLMNYRKREVRLKCRREKHKSGAGQIKCRKMEGVDSDG